MQLTSEQLSLNSIPGLIELRPARAADAAAVADLMIICKRTLLPYLPQVHSDTEVHSWIADHLIPGVGVSVAVHRQRVVGMMALSRDADFGWIDQLYLQPDMVSLGLGSALLTRAKQVLDAPIRLYTFQLNTGSQRFYERHGFEAIAFSDGQNNEERCPDVLLEWRASLPG